MALVKPLQFCLKYSHHPPWFPVTLHARPQSNELTREPPRVSSALSFIVGIHIGARALHVLNFYGLAISLAYPSGEEGGNLLVQKISTCRHEEGGGGRHPVCKTHPPLWLLPSHSPSYFFLIAHLSLLGPGGSDLLLHIVFRLLQQLGKIRHLRAQPETSHRFRNYITNILPELRELYLR